LELGGAECQRRRQADGQQGGQRQQAAATRDGVHRARDQPDHKEHGIDPQRKIGRERHGPSVQGTDDFDSAECASTMPATWHWLT
jgi:hypothetical protein